MGEGHGWAVAQRRVRADTIGVVLPGSDHDLSLFQVVEDFQPQALIPKFAQRGRPPDRRGPGSCLGRVAPRSGAASPQSAQAHLATFGHPGLLWFKLILSISPAQKQPVRSMAPRGNPILSRPGAPRSTPDLRHRPVCGNRGPSPVARRRCCPGARRYTQASPSPSEADIAGEP